MSDKAKPEFSLDQFSEAETDEEFGLPEFKEHFADTLTPAVLRDWTAKDFASIYVRFRPHLERHARRFLVNPSQVEEVVQDAFLYLMTTLPELDSELGVLKFLKWKVRLLSLDVIRANSRASVSPLEELPDIESDEPETSQGLERAEDAAIVSMALAKLQPRQREALIATLYEEKSTEVVASQMGLSENAFRQLLFRARSSFKKALVGEAETAGMSVAEILSVAARKAAREAGLLASITSVWIIVLVSFAGAGSFFTNTDLDAASSSRLELQRNSNIKANSEGPTAKSLLSQEPDLTQTEANVESYQGPDLLQISEVSLITENGSNNSSELLTEPTTVTQLDNTNSDQLNQAIDLATLEQFASIGGVDLTAQEKGRGDSVALTLTSGSGIEASLLLVLSENADFEVDYLWLRFRSGGADLIGLPMRVFVESSMSDSTYQVQVTGADIVIGDHTGAYGNAVSDTSIFGINAVIIDLAVAADLSVSRFDIRLSTRASLISTQ